MSDLSATKMAFSEVLAGRVRKYLDSFPDLKIEEKKMFSGIAFLVNGKMCVNVSGENLMCMYDPALDDEVIERVGFQIWIMRGKQRSGYCYVSPSFNTVILSIGLSSGPSM